MHQRRFILLQLKMVYIIIQKKYHLNENILNIPVPMLLLRRFVMRIVKFVDTILIQYPFTSVGMIATILVTSKRQ